jgi:hypothetical protein
VLLGGADQPLGELEHQSLGATHLGGIDVALDSQAAQRLEQAVGIQG